MKIGRILIMALVLAMLACGAVWAATTNTDSATLNISATVNAKAKLTVDSTTVTFPDADPESGALIPASEGAIGVHAKVRVGTSPATLTWIAADDLKSGTDTITIDNVTWTATGTGFTVNGTLNKTTAQSVGSWAGSGSYDGTISPFLTNSWNYKAGSYAVSSTLTLSAP